MNLFEEIKSGIQKSKKVTRLVYAEGWNSMIYSAAVLVQSESHGLIQPILIFRSKKEVPNQFNPALKKIVIGVDDLSKYENLIFELRKNKGITIEQAKELATQPNFLASAIVAANDADAEICGIEYTTADTLRSALQIVKPAPNVKTVCSAFIMQKNNERLIFGDCSVNVYPDAESLSSIAKSLAVFAKNVAGVRDVRMALLSYSTIGSGKGESVDKVTKAYELIKLDEDFMSKYKVFGEIQFDAAYDLRVMHKKAPELNWNTSANVFCFPNIDAGNIGYKIAQRLGGYDAVGPIVLGLNKPVNDLSRGANTDDVVKLSYITSMQVINS